MSVIDEARKLAASVKNEDVYKSLIEARKANDEDKELQDLIGKFNLLRMDIDNEIAKENRDDNRLKEMNAQLSALYTEIMSNEKMDAFNKAKGEADMLLNKIYALFVGVFNDEDPMTMDLDASCSGDCSSCGGCH